MAADLTVSEHQARDQAIMVELRANGGKTKGGQRLIILTIEGATTGRKHQKPVCVREDGDDLVIAASFGGRKMHPQWYRNLVAHPEITVEYLGESYAVRASTVPNSPARDGLFHMLSEEISDLYGYQDRCRDSRQIPVIRLSRI